MDHVSPRGSLTKVGNESRGNEKGGVEGEVGYFRRNHLVPVPRVESLDELNQLLLDGCHADEQRRIAGKPHTVGEAMRIERAHLLALPAEGFELAETSFPMVDGKGCVKVRTKLLLDAAEAGHARAREAAAGLCRSVARAGVRGAARAQFLALRAGARSGALSRRAGAQAGFPQSIPAVPFAQPEQLDHLSRAFVSAMPFLQALPQVVEALRPAPAFAPLRQRTRSRQRSRRPRCGI
jgi:hypothetical protein